MLGPQVADRFGQAFAVLVFHSQDHLAKQALVRSQPEHALEMKTRIAANRAAIFQESMRSHCGGASRAGGVRIGGQGGSTGKAEVFLFRGQRTPAGAANGRIQEVQKPLSQLPAK
jgi:hypothetical protein